VGTSQPGDPSQSLAVGVLRNEVLRGGSAPRLALQLVLFFGRHTTPATWQDAKTGDSRRQMNKTRLNYAVAGTKIRLLFSRGEIVK